MRAAPAEIMWLISAFHRSLAEARRLLAVRRHFNLFENDMLTDDGIVLLELELTLLGSLVLVRVVCKPGTGRRDEADSIAHGGVRVSCGPADCNPTHTICE